MTDNMPKREHDEIDLLLPWYVNDTLDPAEHDRLSKHVATCAECRENVSLLAEMQAVMIRNKATPIVPQPRVDELLDSIATGNPLRHRERRQPRIIFAAAAVTLLLIAMLIPNNQDDRSGIPQNYETATSHQDSASMDYVLRIQFESGITPTDRDRVLEDIGARDVSGGNDEGSYRVIVQLSAASLEQLDRYTGNLASLSEISSVSVIALQLPMRKEQ